MATVPAGTTSEADAAIMAARAAFESWSALPVETRAAYLDKVAAGIKARTDELALAIAREVGMPLKMARAIQVGGGDGFSCAIGTGEKHLIMSHNGFLFRSEDVGKSWRRAESGLPTTHLPFDARVRAVPGDAEGKTFVTVRQTSITGLDGKAAQGPGGVFKSVDGGASWAETADKVTRKDGSVVTGIPGTIRTVDVSRTDPNVWAAVTDQGFIYTTADGGASWKESTKVAGKGTALPTENINAVEFDPKDPKTFYAASGTGWGQRTEAPGVRPSYVFKTTDGGDSWTPITGSPNAKLPNVQCNELRVDPNDSNHLVAATTVGLYRSRDGGANWQRYDMPYVDTTGVVISNDGKSLVTGTYGRDYFSAPA